MEKTEKWDSVAANYQKVFALGDNDYNAKLIAFLLDNDMLHPGDRVIDMGCGVGKYGKLFASLGCDVTLADISAKMLGFAAQNMAEYKTPWRVMQCDFDEMSADAVAEGGKYDLSISTMSPAVHDVATAKKFADITKSWCFIAAFSQWAEPDRERLFKLMGIERESFNSSARGDCAELIRSVSAAGFTPQIKYVDYCWSDERDVDETVRYMENRYFEPSERTDELHGRLTEAVSALSHDGIFTDSVNTKVAWIYWSTK